VIERGRLQLAYAVALNGQHVVTDPDTTLRDGDVLVMVSAHAGG
jgi:hypothetical protein